jgi:putative flippase GtrA
MTTTLEPAQLQRRPLAATSTSPAVDVVVPVHNEANDLRPSVQRLHRYLRTSFPFSFRITIADNASTDGTWQIAEGLAAQFPDVTAVRLEQKGRGRALAATWGASDAHVLCYMDVDLSTDLAALLPLVAPLLSGHSDLAIGTRLSGSARVVRGSKREIISRCYNALLHATLSTRFSDAQCGFKAIRADRARELLPHVRDTAWFFDTELLVLAQRSGMRIHEVPVDWVDDPDSRVDIVPTAIADLRGVARLAAAGTARQLRRFGGIGVLSTIAYVVLYLVLRNDVGTGISAGWSNAIALLATAIANTAANRAFTFGVRSKRHRLRHQVRGLVAFAVALAVSTSALAALHTAVPHAPQVVEVTALVAANLLATAMRFVLLRSWVFADDAALTARPAAAILEEQR